MYKKKNVKNNRKTIIIPIVILLLLILTCLVIFSFNNGKYYDENHVPDPDDSEHPLVETPFNKSDVLTLIYQLKEINDDKSNWNVNDTSLIAHNADNSKYLIRYKKEFIDGSLEEFESIVTINGEEKKLDLPGWPVDSKDLTEFNFIYYSPDSAGYDPENQKYSSDLIILD